MYATIISIFLILTQFFLTVPIFLDINIETNHSLKKQESNANTTGFDGVSFSKENSSVLSKMLWKLNGVLPKFCFREKWRQKFHEWRKMYCLDLFQMNQFRDLFFFLMHCKCVFFNAKAWRGEMVVKGWDFCAVTYLYWSATFWYGQKMGTEIFHSIEI